MAADETPISVDATETPLRVDPTETPLRVDPTETPLRVDPTETPIRVDPTERPLNDYHTYKTDDGSTYFHGPKEYPVGDPRANAPDGIHPDDVEISAGGYTDRLISQGQPKTFHSADVPQYFVGAITSDEPPAVNYN